jgi:hypothetical protein
VGEADGDRARRKSRSKIPGQQHEQPHDQTGRRGPTRPVRPGPSHTAGPRNSWNSTSAPGWNAGWTPHPQAAKPGVIPLRPLRTGEILEGSISAIRAHWHIALGLALVVAVITELATALTTHFWFDGTERLEKLTSEENPDLDDLKHSLPGALAHLGVTGIIVMLGSVIATALLTVVVSRAVLGRPIALGEAWRDARPQLLPLLGLLLLVPLLVSLVLIGCLLPGILAASAGSADLAVSLLFLGLLGGTIAAAWVWVSLCLAPPALMLEKHGLIAATRRSVKLARGSRWRILGVQLLALVLVFAITFVISLPTALIDALLSGGDTLTDPAAVGTGWSTLVVNSIGSIVATTITLPFTASITALLYLDQRIRREALDLELARAAGVPGFER